MQALQQQVVIKSYRLEQNQQLEECDRKFTLSIKQRFHYPNKLK